MNPIYWVLLLIIAVIFFEFLHYSSINNNVRKHNFLREYYSGNILYAPPTIEMERRFLHLCVKLYEKYHSLFMLVYKQPIGTLHDKFIYDETIISDKTPYHLSCAVLLLWHAKHINDFDEFIKEYHINTSVISSFELNQAKLDFNTLDLSDI